MRTDLRQDHQQLVDEVAGQLRGNAQPLRVKKATSSNLFRYGGRSASTARRLDLSRFNRPLHVDADAQTLDVEGFTTYEQIVDYLLPSGLMTTITPELKHITVGGAVVGIGIESNSYRYGFVHHALVEAEVLLPDGTVVTCSADNEHADLFHALPNSYGTFGYILRATVRLRPARPYVVLQTQELRSVGELVDAARAAVEDPANDYVEALAYAPDRLYLTATREVETAPGELTSIYGTTPFYRHISRPGQITMTLRDYLFRYDPDWFWALPDTPAYRLFRTYAPARFRHSGFYYRYNAWRRDLARKMPFASSDDHSIELLIQDWEVPWRHAAALLTFVLENADLRGNPLMVAPLRVPASATLYPMTPGELYLNVGSYNYIRRRADQQPYQSTKAIDEFCFAHDGIKMLYSSTFLDQDEFSRHYGGAAYGPLKEKYDPAHLLPTLFEKAVQGR